MSNGTLVNPGTANTLKMDAAGANGTGAVKINTTITSQFPDDGSTSSSSSAFKDVTAASGVTIPALFKLLGLFPYDASAVGTLWHRNAGERLAFRGGNYTDGAGAGLFALSLHYERTFVYSSVGFRPAFTL